MLRIYLIILCLLTFCPKILYSKETLYLFGGAGYSNYDIGDSDITEINNKVTGLGFGTSKTTTDIKKFSYEYGFGLEILKILTVEISYLDMGQISLATSTTTPSESLNTKINIEGISIDLIKNIGPIGLTGGILKIDNDIKISSSLGNANAPIDDLFLPKIGGNIKINNYRFEINRTFITPNSHINNIMISYIFGIF